MPRPCSFWIQIEISIGISVVLLYAFLWFGLAVHSESPNLGGPRCESSLFTRTEWLVPKSPVAYHTLGLLPVSLLPLLLPAPHRCVGCALYALLAC